NLALFHLCRRHQHFRRHPRHIRTFWILQPHLQCDRPYVALPAPHIPLRREIRFRRLIKNFPRNHRPSRQPHPQRVSQSNMIGVRLRNRREHPGVAEIHHRHNRLPRVHYFAFARLPHQHRPRYRRINFRISQPHFRFFQLRHRVLHLRPRRCHRTLCRRRLIRARDRRIQIRLPRCDLIPQRLHARFLRLQIHFRLYLLLLRCNSCLPKPNRPPAFALHPRQSRFRIRQLRPRRLQPRLRIRHIPRRRPLRRLPRVFALADLRPQAGNRSHRFPLLRLQLRRIQQRDQIPLLPLRSFLHQQFLNPPLNLRTDHNLVSIHRSHQNQVFAARSRKEVVPRSNRDNDRQQNQKLNPRTHYKSPSRIAVSSTLSVLSFDFLLFAPL